MICFGAAVVSSSKELAALESSEPVVALLATRGLFLLSRFLSSVDTLLGSIVDDRLLSLLPFCDELVDFLGCECCRAHFRIRFRLLFLMTSRLMYVFIC